jgi:hypothetical protein
MGMKEYLNKGAGVPEWGLPEYADEHEPDWQERHNICNMMMTCF